MWAKFLFYFFVLTLLSGTTFNVNAIPAAEQICGKWESTEKNLVVQVYMQENKFRAKIIWFKDGDEQQMGTWTDFRNPDPELRNRKILGMSVLTGLTYEADSNSWEDGMIYDAKHGRDWNAAAYIDKKGQLKVKGYWHFKFFGRTLTFNRLL